MKKLVAMLLALCMMLCLCACGEKNVSGGVTPAETKGVSGTVTQTPEEPEEELQVGHLEGGRYENAFLGIGCKLDDNWTFANQDELAQMVGMTADMFDDDYGDKLKELNMFYDMMAVADGGLVSINVVIQNIGVLYGAILSEEQFLDAAQSELKTQLGSAGLENIETNIITVNFAGEERSGIHISSTMQGIPYYCTQISLKQGGYISTVSLCSFSEDITENLIDYFFALED